MNLLVVDDDSVMRMVLRTLLRSEGYSVVTAADGDEALAKLSESPFDMLITDICMPRIDGVRLRDLVRQGGGKTLPIIFISGYDDRQTMASVQDPTLEGFFRKGRPLTELLNWIRYLSTPVRTRPAFPPDHAAKPSVRPPMVAREQRRSPPPP